MRQTAVKLAKSYTPMIKFVGTKHPVIQHSGNVAAHPCTTEGITPGSQQCIPAGEYLRKVKPFEVVAYKPKSGAQKSSGGAKGPKYEFTNRSLQENEVASILDLPPRFKLRPFEEAEIDAINAGGAL